MGPVTAKPLLRDLNGPRLLRWHFEASRLTIRRYAASIFRSERTVSRWLDGDTAIPRSYLAHLREEYDRAVASNGAEFVPRFTRQ